jgi:hypothetical protein
MVVLSLAAVAALAGADAHASSPAFRLETAKPGYLIGEPVVVTITQRGTAAIYDEGWQGLGVDDAHFRILVDRGSGFTRFRRRVLYSTAERSAVRTLVPDGRRQEFVLSFDEAIGDVVFPHAGPAAIVVEYRDDVLGVLRSNVVTVAIVEPAGVERSAYEKLRSMPQLGSQFYLELTVVDDAPDLSDAASQAFVREFPRSVYGQGARVRRLEYRFGHASDRYHPDDLASPSPSDRRERSRLVSARRAALVDQAEALVSDLSGGQFEPDALAILASTYDANGQDDLARRTWQRVIDRFAGRQAADDAREALVEDEPEG